MRRLTPRDPPVTTFPGARLCLAPQRARTGSFPHRAAVSVAKRNSILRQTPQNRHARHALGTTRRSRRSTEQHKSEDCGQDALDQRATPASSADHATQKRHGLGLWRCRRSHRTTFAATWAMTLGGGLVRLDRESPDHKGPGCGGGGGDIAETRIQCHADPNGPSVSPISNHACAFMIFMQRMNRGNFQAC
jgi:ribosomal protein L37AE/L43A